MSGQAAHASQIGLARAALVLVAVLLCPASADAAAQPIFGPQRQVLSLAHGANPLDLTSADLTGDGLQDILVLRGKWASTDAFPISLLANDGRGGFSDRTAELFEGPAPSAVWPRQALIADFNGDGRPDIFIGDTGIDQPPFPGHLNYLALSTPSGKYVDARANLPQDVVYFHSGAAGDVDGDGDNDIFLADLGTPIRLLLNDGSGHFTTASGRLPPEAGIHGKPRYTRSALVDVNRDRSLDLVLLAENQTPASAVLLNDGNGFFTELPNALPPKPFGADAIGIAIQAMDLTADGIVDLMLGYTKGNPWYVGRWIQIAVGNGDGTFRDETATRLPQTDNNAEWPYEIVLGDLNRDGSLDFAVDIGATFCCPGKKVAPPVYLNRGDGSFEALGPAAFVEPPDGQVRFVDANQDGDLDLFSVWQHGWNSEERYAVQLQNDDDGDGIANAADRCPKVAGPVPSGCPSATLTRRGRVRARRKGKRGVRVVAGVEASCPAADIACTGRIALSGRRLRRHRSRFQVPAGQTVRISVKLSRRAVAALRRARTLRVRLSLVLTGPDLTNVTLSRSGTIRLPKRLRGTVRSVASAPL